MRRKHGMEYLWRLRFKGSTSLCRGVHLVAGIVSRDAFVFPLFLGLFPPQESFILWMDKILHHFETTGNHGMLVFTGQSNHSRVSWVVQFCPYTALFKQRCKGASNSSTKPNLEKVPSRNPKVWHILHGPSAVGHQNVCLTTFSGVLQAERKGP